MSETDPEIVDLSYPPAAEQQLRREGLDPDRLSSHRLGWPRHLLWFGYAPWVWTALVGLGVWAVVVPLERFGISLPPVARGLASLGIGLLVLKSACDALVTGTERLAARRMWNHYVAGTVAEIVSTLPELIVICFVIPVSPVAAMVIALVTIYNNALVFSVYSYFLPKDRKGQFLMPAAITEVGTQLLIAGAGLGSVIGIVMLVFSAGGHPKQAFEAVDLGVLAVIMLLVFAVYLQKLIRGYASEEQTVQRALGLDADELERRKAHIYGNVKRTSTANIVFLFLAGSVLAFVGSERVSEFARTAIEELHLDPISAAICLAAFAGMSEYVILWRAHRKKQYGIALANAFGGITQVMFLVLPFTLLAIAFYQFAIAPDHADLPIVFSLSNVLLFVLLFPTFYVLIALIEEDHTLGALDTVTMVAIFSLVILILVTYGET
jgi:Ca2+/Na+ antiporter